MESATAVRQEGGTVHGSGLLGGTVTGVPACYEMTVALTHPGDDDHARVRTWLPASGWNGRLQALGGSAYAAGDNGVGCFRCVPPSRHRPSRHRPGRHRPGRHRPSRRPSLAVVPGTAEGEAA